MKQKDQKMNREEKEKGKRGKGKRKRRMQSIPYDYESAYNKQLEQCSEWMLENMFVHDQKVVYALKEIKAGDQFEVEIYPQFKNMAEVPKEGQKIVKDNRAQNNLNDKNSRKFLERKINANFGDGDIWMTATYDEEHLPADGDMDAAYKDMKSFIGCVNRERKKRGLSKAKWIYVTEYDKNASIRWHHHIIMDGALDMDVVEKCWKKGRRNEVRRLKKDDNGLTGMADYIVKQKDRLKSEKRWHCSRGLLNPDIKVVHSKQPEKGKGNYKPVGKYVDGFVKNQNTIKDVLVKWYPEYDFTNAQVYYNNFNYKFYIHARMRKKKERDMNVKNALRNED